MRVFGVVRYKLNIYKHTWIIGQSIIFENQNIILDALTQYIPRRVCYSGSSKQKQFSATHLDLYSYSTSSERKIQTSKFTNIKQTFDRHGFGAIFLFSDNI